MVNKQLRHEGDSFLDMQKVKFFAEISNSLFNHGVLLAFIAINVVQCRTIILMNTYDERQFNEIDKIADI